jgi:hypothetical protein
LLAIHWPVDRKSRRFATVRSFSSPSLLSGRNRPSEAAKARHPAGISLVALDIAEDGNIDEF